ncbi:MAG: NUDIX hydrolase [Patescibacteria group bacterium]
MGEGKARKELVREFSAGGVVFKKTPKSFLWLIIKPAGTDRWQLPKGRIDAGETSGKAAIREVEEEGGVKVRPIKKLGTSQYFFTFEDKRIFKTVSYFLMEYLQDNLGGHDHEVEETLFLPFRDAYEKLTFKDDKKMLGKAERTLGQGIQENLV